MFEVKQDVDEALKLYTIAIEVDPTCIEAHVHVGMLYLTVNRIDDAIKAYDVAIELSPVEHDLKTIYRFREAATLRRKLLAMGLMGQQ